jgi:hypothetical protein
VAWFRRRKWLMLASVAAIFLAVSKGALLGLLVFAVIWSFYRADRGFFLIASAVSLLFGGGFVVYSWFHSTKSLFGHVLGFVSALRVLVSHPWGYGLGNIGTLAAQFSTTPRVQPGIRESGLGMVIGQLGVVGLLLYASLFRLILRRVALLPPRERVLGFSLFVGIVLNILFNEVALSPNSCAGHFLTLGMLCAPAVLWTNTRAEPGRSFS